MDMVSMLTYLSKIFEFI